jgi:hypothetical protein
MFSEETKNKPEEQPLKPQSRKKSVEEDVGYWPDPERTDQEKLRDDL